MLDRSKLGEKMTKNKALSLDDNSLSMLFKNRLLNVYLFSEFNHINNLLLGPNTKKYFRLILFSSFRKLNNWKVSKPHFARYSKNPKLLKLASKLQALEEELLNPSK